MPIGPGVTLHNRYRVVRLLGQGGFGAVYRAWDLNLQRPCAIKENLETATESQEQFQREARMLSNLTHSNLPRVTDYFIIPNQGQYLVMDFIDGQDLQDMLDEAGEPLPEAQALVWIEQVSDALSYLHSQKPAIIHRDIKPKNIIINSNNKAFLVDFGIAKVFDPNQQTTLGARAVTPGYSPVEQYGHGKTDNRTDVYALGATLYTMLTNQVPVESVNRNENPLIPPRNLNPNISQHTESVILTAMELAPSNRFQSMAEFRKALKSEQASPPIAATAVVAPPVAPTIAASPPSPYNPAASVGGGASVPPAKRRSPWSLIGIGVVLLMIITAALLIVPTVTGAGSLPLIGALLASETPTATTTSTPTMTFTLTSTATATNTATSRPTDTPVPSSTPTQTSAPIAAAPTRKPTNTPAPTNTPTLTATPSTIVLLTPTKDTTKFYQGAASCGPNEVTFRISAEGPITDELMFLFWNIQDKTTGNAIGWNNGQIMNKIRGENTWTFTFNANTMTGALPYKESWFIYQFILQARGGSNEKWRTPSFSDITIATCP